MTTRSSRRLGRCGLLAGALLLASIGEVRADAAADRAAAQAAFAEGRRLRGAGDRAQAIVQFRRAHELAPTPVTRLELARELASAGQLVEAEALAATAASLPVTATETGKSKVARTEATAFAEALAARVPVLRLAFVPAGPEPEVAIDGSPVSKELLAAGEVRVDPGKHVLRATRGDAVAEATVTVAESERPMVELRFPEPVPATTTLPPAPSPIPPASLYPAERPATAAPPPAATSERRGMTPLVPISFGIAGAALITGAITGALAIDQAGRLEEACTTEGVCPPGAQDLLGTHQTVTTVSTIAFSVAGAAAVLGALALILDDRGGPAQKAGAGVRGTPFAKGSVMASAKGLQWTW